MKQDKQNLSRRIAVWLIVQEAVMAVFLLLLLLPVMQRVRLFLICIFAAWSIGWLYSGYRRIVLPMRELKKAYRAFAEGYTIQDVFQARYGLDEDHEAMMERLRSLLATKDLLDSSKKQAEYLALQNQINPHFLYNTLEGIRSEALISGVETVAEMTETLATFFRYTISNLDSLVTVEDELANVENYFLIQRFRFGERLNLSIEYGEHDEDTIMECKMPRLILQPIVENAIRHGLEPKIGTGLIKIRFQLTENRLIIFISDDGVGMEEKMLVKLNRQLKGTGAGLQEHTYAAAKKQGGIAMTNVNNRIKLIFGDEYGMQFYSTKNVGTDVEITLPIVKE